MFRAQSNSKGPRTRFDECIHEQAILVKSNRRKIMISMYQEHNFGLSDVHAISSLASDPGAGSLVSHSLRMDPHIICK